MRIFNHLNHISHAHSLYQIPGVEWFVLSNNVRRWVTDIRPQPDITYVPYYESGKYDCAVLHLDQQVIDPDLGKAKLFRDLRSVVNDIPVIVINHGTPYWMEKWEGSPDQSLKYPKNVKTYEQKMEYQKQYISKEVKKLIGNATMVVNSHQAQKEWGWGEVIIHGLDPNEWWSLPKEPRIVTCISSGGLDYYYGRDLYFNTRNELDLIYGLPVTNIGEDWHIEKHDKLAEIGGFGAYRDFLGRSLIYFNPTKESPMPRSRTEAMLSGCCIVTTGNHGADKIFNCDTRKIWEKVETVKQFIEVIDQLIVGGKINGFIIPDDPIPTAALLNHLLNFRFAETVLIGYRGRQLAKKLFSKERFDDDWKNLLNKVVK